MGGHVLAGLVARARTLVRERNWPEALTVLLRAEEMSQLECQPDDMTRATVLGMLADTYRELGRKPEAEQALNEARRIATIHLPDLSSRTARAKLLMEEKKLSAVKDALLEAVDIARLALGPNHSRVGELYDMLKHVCRELGHKDEEEEALHETMRIRSLHLRRQAAKLSDLQKFSEAEKLYRKALKICEDTFGPE